VLCRKKKCHKITRQTSWQERGSVHLYMKGNIVQQTDEPWREVGIVWNMRIQFLLCWCSHLQTHVKHETKETKPFRKHMNGNQSAFSAHLLTTTSSIWAEKKQSAREKNTKTKGIRERGPAHHGTWNSWLPAQCALGESRQHGYWLKVVKPKVQHTHATAPSSDIFYLCKTNISIS
jgi:hypothetical protein